MKLSLLIATLLCLGNTIAQNNYEKLISKTWHCCDSCDTPSFAYEITFTSKKNTCSQEKKDRDWIFKKDHSFAYTDYEDEKPLYVLFYGKWKIENEILMIGENWFHIDQLTDTTLSLSRIHKK